MATPLPDTLPPVDADVALWRLCLFARRYSRVRDAADDAPAQDFDQAIVQAQDALAQVATTYAALLPPPAVPADPAERDQLVQPDAVYLAQRPAKGRQPAQAMVEFALCLTLGLFVLGCSVDLIRGFGQDALAGQATSLGATLAASGQGDRAVTDAVLAVSQGAIRPADIQVTPCYDRPTVGSPVTVATAWSFKPVFPLTETFWSTSGRSQTPIRHSVTLQATASCS